MRCNLPPVSEVMRRDMVNEADYLAGFGVNLMMMFVQLILNFKRALYRGTATRCLFMPRTLRATCTMVIFLGKVTYHSMKYEANVNVRVIAVGRQFLATEQKFILLVEACQISLPTLNNSVYDGFMCDAVRSGAFQCVASSDLLEFTRTFSSLPDLIASVFSLCARLQIAKRGAKKDPCLGDIPRQRRINMQMG